MTLWTLALRNLSRRPARSGLTGLGIAVALGSFVALVGLSRGLERAWVGALHERGTHIFAMRKAGAHLLAATIDQGVADRVARTPGVVGVSGELFDLVELETGDTTLVVAWAVPNDLWATLTLVAGRLPGGEREREAIVGEQIAESLNTGVGGTVLLNGAAFTVVGICRSSGVMTGRAIMVPLGALQAVQEKQDRVTVLHVRVSDPDDDEAMARVLNRLATTFPALSFSLSDDVAEGSYFVRIARAMSWGTSAIALSMALLMVLNTLLMSVVERRREIGVLSAVGWSQRRTLSLIVAEGLALTGAGCILGMALGVLAMRGLTSAPQIGGLVEPSIGLRTVVEMLVLMLVLGSAGSAYPAWRAIRQDPIDTLRAE